MDSFCIFSIILCIIIILMSTYMAYVYLHRNCADSRKHALPKLPISSLRPSPVLISPLEPMSVSLPPSESPLVPISSPVPSLERSPISWYSSPVSSTSELSPEIPHIPTPPPSTSERSPEIPHIPTPPPSQF
ncbi:hypothetical protein HgNV_064 [Homarus gammarus nudivirus]|uniref:Uncharacterized protein n=1 Tax=Homarus gammarus nudivirus TaxID=2509616 RepID=A0A411HBA1_9VIRU|nr:hypothetical protein KM727_gp64 [Homarus gammarus nudivirus]QBB28669.1 hypothetical protein HgNV_064 [Homarus gammarus nudivirus]